MEYLVSTATLPYRRLETLFHVANRAGADGLELVLPTGLDAIDTAAIKRLERAYEVPIRSVHVPLRVRQPSPDRLAQDIAFVARSLGLRALIAPKPVNGTPYWRLFISGDCTELPLRVVRKIPSPRRQKKDVLRSGFTLHDVGAGRYFGFTIDGDHRYLLGDFTVTHNSGKTIMLSAAVGEHIGGSAAKAAVLAHRDELTA